MSPAHTLDKLYLAHRVDGAVRVNGSEQMYCFKIIAEVI